MDSAMTDAPSAAWHGGDSVLSTFSVDWLNSHGYRDLGPSTQAVDTDFDADRLHRRTAKHILDVGLEEPEPIHPVFREDRWVGLSLGDYDGVRSALQLASRILDEPAVLSYFRGMLRDDVWRDIDPRTTSKKFPGSRRRSFRAMTCTDRLEQKSYWQRLIDLTRDTRWRFSRTLVDFYALTMVDTEQRRTHLPIMISMDSQFLDILTRRVRSPTGDWESALLRTRVHFAIVAVHEFCHAVYCSNYYHFNERANKYEMVQTPYYGDQRKAEVGNAFEQKTFSGIVEGLGRRETRLFAPYGLVVFRWPSLEPAHGLEEQLASAAKWKTKWNTRYPVSMEWVWGLFKTAFWDYNVMHYGLQALRPPRTVGVRVKEWRGLDIGESPSTPIKPPASPESSEEGEEDEGGIVHRPAFDIMDDIDMH